MLLPGTFLGVWNLLTSAPPISESPGAPPSEEEYYKEVTVRVLGIENGNPD